MEEWRSNVARDRDLINKHEFGKSSTCESYTNTHCQAAIGQKVLVDPLSYSLQSAVKVERAEDGLTRRPRCIGRF
jgi:hypothetical protein